MQVLRAPPAQYMRLIYFVKDKLAPPPYLRFRSVKIKSNKGTGWVYVNLKCTFSVSGFHQRNINVYSDHEINIWANLDFLIEYNYNPSLILKL